MPIRIKDIANTASASSTLDFFAIDGNTNNTRKLSAFSPVFGGSVTANSTGSFFGDGGAAVADRALTVRSIQGSNFRTVASFVNTTTGTGATTSLEIISDGTTGFLQTYGPTYGTGAYASGAFLVNGGANAVVGLSAHGAGGYIKFIQQSFGNEIARFSPTSANLLVGGTTDIPGSSGLKVFGNAGATNTTSGALQVVGGVGIGGALWTAGYFSTSGHARIGAQGSLVAFSANNNVDSGLPASWTGNYGVGVQYLGTSSNAFFIGDGSGGSTYFYTRASSVNTPRLTIDNTNGNTTIGGTATASDFLVAGSSSSIRSLTADRAARQELVFDGTRGVACSTPVLNGDWSVAFVANRATSAVQQYLIGNDVSGCFYLGFRTNGNLFSGKAGAPANTDLTLGNVVGVTQHIVLVRSGSTITAYSNGTAVGTTTDAQAYSSAAATLFAADSAGSSAFNGTGALVGFYNRALSATEVAALYTNGTPAPFDYWAAGSGVNVADCGTLALFNGATYSSSTSTSITGLNLPATNGQVQIGGGYNTVKGQRVRITFSVTGVTDPSQIWIRWVNSGPETWVPINTAGVTGSSGTYSYEHTTEVSGLNYIQFRNFGAVAQNGINVTNWSSVTIGLRVAPDAAQPGGGLTWYDTSNNFINLTLPSTGVLWSVRTSGKTATDFTVGGNLFAGTTYVTAPNGFHLDTNGSASLRYDDNGTSKWWLYKLNGDVNLYLRDMVNARMQATFTPAASSSFASTTFWSTLFVDSTNNSTAWNTGALQVAGGIGAAGALFSQQSTNAIATGTNFSNTSTGAAATLRHTLIAGANTSTIEAYGATHGTFPGRLRFGTNNGQMDFVPSGVYMAAINANGLIVNPLHTSARHIESQVTFAANSENYLRISSNSGGGIYGGEYGYGLTSAGDPELRINRIHAGTISNVLKIRTSDGAATFAGAFTASGTSSFLRVSNITQNTMLADFSSPYAGGAAFPYLVLGSASDPNISGARIAVGTDYSNNYAAALFFQTRNTAGTIQTSLSIANNQTATFSSSVTTGGKVEVQRLTQPNDTSEPYFTGLGGTDATLGALIVHIGGRTSATGGNRYGYISVGDNAAMRPLSLCDNGTGGYGQVLVRSTINSTDKTSGALVIGNGTNGGLGVSGAINAGGPITTGSDGSLVAIYIPGDSALRAAAGKLYLDTKVTDGGDIVLRPRISAALTLAAATGNATFASTVIANAGTNAFRIPTAQTPASQTATGTTGQITWDSSYIYVCTATNNWGRSSLSWSGGGGGGGTSAQVDTYTTTGSVLTWTKPAGAKAVTIIANGGGGQGGGGALVAIGASFGNGGGGGGGGAMNIKTFAADSLPSALYVTVGAGGSTGGLGASGTVPAIGTAGQAGGNSVVATNNTPSPTTGLLIIAGGGGGGKGGQDATNSVGGGGGGTGGAGTTGTGTTSVAGGAGIGGAGATGQGNNNGQPSEWGGGGGTGAGSSNANIFGGGSSIHGGGGGGMAGAGFNTTGGAGGASGTWGTGGGGAGGATDAAGTAGASATTLYSSGAGGGGAGRKNVAGNGFAGGAGGFPSGGGGGGGFARDTGFTGGAGGAGGNGRVIIITYF